MLEKAQALIHRNDIRDGDDKDKPYVVSPLRDNVPEGWQGLLQGLVDVEVEPDVRDRLRGQLLEYCRRDTLVMVRLLELLRELAMSVPRG